MDHFRYPILFRIQYPVLSSIILADFKTAEKKFLDQGIAQDEIKEYFEHFKTLKPRIPEASDRDIDQWVKRGWTDFKDFLDKLKGTKSKTKLKKLEKMEGAELVAENEGWLVYRIKNHQASRQYGYETKWCIAEENSNHWDNLSKSLDFYFLISKIKRESPWNKIAVQVDETGKKGYWDERDNDQSGVPRNSIPKELKVPNFKVEKFVPKITINEKTYTTEEFQKTKNLKVNGNLNLSENASLQSLPEGLKVSGNLNLGGCTSLQSLPEGLEVSGYLDLGGCTSLQSLPEGLKVSGDLNLRGCTSLYRGT